MSSPASDTDLPVAATVVLVRDGARGAEVLMLRRPERGSFAGAWVFPGGKIDDADREGAGSDAAEPAVARLAAVRETREEVGLALDAARLLTVSCWVPPAHTALRIRTWFFAAEAPGGEIVPQPDEVEEYAWLRPVDALDRHGRGELRLYPPTWVTLSGLSDRSDAAAALAEIRLAGIRRFETRFHPAAPSTLLWQEDAEYGTGGTAEARHRLEIGALPWVYTRSSHRGR